MEFWHCILVRWFSHLYLHPWKPGSTIAQSSNSFLKMAAIRMTTNILLNGVSQSAFRALSTKCVALAFLRSSPYTGCRKISIGSFRCAAASEYGEGRKKASARLSQVQQLLVEAEERASSGANEPPPPKISLGNPSLFCPRKIFLLSF